MNDSEVVGLLLAGGRGSRLYPATKVVSKHLLPVYDKPMILYSLSILLMTGVKEIVVVVDGVHYEAYRQLLTGELAGLGRVKLHFEIQEEPLGICDAIQVATPKILGRSVCVVLGDNFILGNEVSRLLKEFVYPVRGMRIFGIRSGKPSQFGVINFKSDGSFESIVEKPLNPESSIVCPGIYFFDSSLVDMLATVGFSNRGEREVADLIMSYQKYTSVDVLLLGRAVRWFDLGTFDNLLTASMLVRDLQEASGLSIGTLDVDGKV